MRKTPSLILPIGLTVLLMGLVIALMVWWIIASAQRSSWTSLTIGAIAFSLVLIGLSFYLFLAIKEKQLNQRQINFVDSVTHELKSPIASLRLYLETLRLRQLEEETREEFYSTMDRELTRLDHLITQLLQVARLDAIGQETPASDVELTPLIKDCAALTCERHHQELDSVFQFALQPVTVRAPRIMLEMIYRNLLDNAVKYGGEDPQVSVRVRLVKNKTVVVEVEDSGEGISNQIRNKIFRLFFRGGDELERRQTGTGVGLYIAHTLVRILGGKISVHNRLDATGCVFRVELPGKALVQ